MVYWKVQDGTQLIISPQYKGGDKGYQFIKHNKAEGTGVVSEILSVWKIF